MFCFPEITHLPFGMRTVKPMSFVEEPKLYFNPVLIRVTHCKSNVLVSRPPYYNRDPLCTGTFRLLSRFRILFRELPPRELGSSPDGSIMRVLSADN